MTFKRCAGFNDVRGHLGRTANHQCIIFLDDLAQLLGGQTGVHLHLKVRDTPSICLIPDSAKLSLTKISHRSLLKDPSVCQASNEIELDSLSK